MKIEIKQNNEKRIQAIHRLRQEEHIKKQEEIDKTRNELLLKKGYAMPNTNNDGISYDATASQVLGMSTSTKHYDMTLPKKKRRDITEYYPGQDDIHSINQLSVFILLYII